MDHPRYQVIGDPDTEPFDFFWLNLWLMSRDDMGGRFGTDGDEDVNMYVAGILRKEHEGLYPKIPGVMEGVGLFHTAVEVHERCEVAGTPRERFEVYRKNGDFNLMNDGIWNDPAVRGNGAILYRNAVANAMHTGVNESVKLVLSRLVERYLTYVDILSHMRGEYLKIMARLRDGEMYHLERESHQAALPVIREHVLNKALDAANAYNNASTEEERFSAIAGYKEIEPSVMTLFPDFRPPWEQN